MKSLNFVYPEARRMVLEEHEVAKPGPNEVLCKADHSLISVGTEIICMRGIFDPGTNWAGWVKYPFMPGYCMVATVLEVGSEVTKVKVGDRVGAFSKHNQYFVCNENATYPIPAEMPSEEAAFIEIGRITSNGIRKLQIQIGDFVVVIGAGLIGMAAMQLTKIAGATTIVHVDPDPLDFRLAKAKSLGAMHTLKMTAAEAYDSISKMTGGKMADVVIDATGYGPTLAQACPLVRKNGKLLILGDCPTPSQQPLGPGVISNYLNLFGVHSSTLAPVDNDFYPWTTLRAGEIICELVQQGRLNYKDMITRRASPMDAPEIYNGMVDGHRPEIGIIFDWNKLN